MDVFLLYVGIAVAGLGLGYLLGKLEFERKPPPLFFEGLPLRAVLGRFCVYSEKFPHRITHWSVIFLDGSVVRSDKDGLFIENEPHSGKILVTTKGGRLVQPS